jgi:hypothetical protein
MSKKKSTAKKSSVRELKMESSTMHQYSAISELSTIRGTPKAIKDWLISLPVDSPASHSPLQDEEKENTTTGICGLKLPEPYAVYDRNTHSLKTFQVSFLAVTSKVKSSQILSKAGMILGGVYYPLPKWELRIREIGCGYSVPTPTATPELPNKNANTKGPKNLMDVATGEWKHLIPTPSAQEAGIIPLTSKDGSPVKVGQRAYNPKTGKHTQMTLNRYVKMFPTPTAKDYRACFAENSEAFRNRLKHKRGVNLVEYLQRQQVCGQLNPEFVEYLMGWPIGSTDLEPLETDKFHTQWLLPGRSYLRELWRMYNGLQ